MDYKSFREDNFSKMSKFDFTFHPWKKWRNVKLTDICPCKNCEYYKERIDNCYVYMMSEGSDEELNKKCEHCIEHTLWTMECIEKLQWYEEKDERLNLL